MADVVDFPEKPGYSKHDLERVQQKLLEMADVVTDILDGNGIRHFITFGTLLGSVRHGGFIPWDDDFDLMLFDDEYEQALVALRRELPEGLIVHDRQTDPIFWPSWSRVRDIHSSAKATLWPDDNAYRYTGVNLDLYRVKRMKKSQVDLYRAKEHLEFVVRKHTSGVMADEVYNKKFDAFAAEYARLLPTRENGVASEDPIGFTSGLPDFIFLEEQTILPLRKYDFCGRKFWGPKDADALLRHMFGDYMTLPPYEKRLSHYDEIVFDQKGA